MVGFPMKPKPQKRMPVSSQKQERSGLLHDSHQTSGEAAIRVGVIDAGSCPDWDDALLRAQEAELSIGIKPKL